ncbi:MAG: DNA translocase FtsK [Acutalibacteraceae bacterium]|nr:DNA translocase FtsK [Acutalibacteraceae bacterium]
MAKRKTTKKHTKQTAKQKRNKHIASVILFFVGVLSFFLFVVAGDSFWFTLHGFWHGVFGNILGLPVTLGLFYLAIICAKDYDTKYITKKCIVLSLGLILISAAIGIFCVADGETFSQSISKVYLTDWWSGGALGAIFAFPIKELMGKTGGAITLVILALLYLVLVTSTSILSVYNFFKKPAEKIKQTAQSAYEKHQEKKEDDGFDVDSSSFAKQISVPIAGEKSDTNPFEIQKTDDETELLTREESKRKGKKVVSAYLGEDGIDINVPVSDIKPASKPERKKRTGVNEDLLSDINSGNITIVSDDAPIKAINTLDNTQTAPPEIPEYKFPPVSLLKNSPRASAVNIKQELKQNADKLVDTLRSFGVETRVIDVSRGPAVTRYELQPAAGVRVSTISKLADDIALNLATDGVRIEAPIPGKPAVGIELPNKVRSSVSFRELIESDGFKEAKSNLTCVLGKDITGEIAYMDIEKMPHVLIAGTTGAGKSVCMNSLIMSILYKARPDEVKMIMIDPKSVELSNYNGIPHLLVPVVTDPKKAAGTLGWAVSEMLERYKLLNASGAKNITAYNKLAEKNNGFARMPHIVIFIDELSDLMMAAPKEVEDSICRIAQMARAAGMHLVIATQRPSVNVITGLIKANIPSRIALTTANAIDSRTIIDTAGAERLIGRGDMLFSPVGVNKPTRVQGCWVSDDEINSVIDFLKRKTSVEYDQNVIEEINRQADSVKGKKGSLQPSDSVDDLSEGDYDVMLPQAMEVVVQAGQASTSLLQRRLKLGYARAARIMDQLEEKGVIGPFEGAKPRKVLMSQQELLEMQATSE